MAAALSHGCYGFAAAYMHWPEQLIVGGATRNSTSALRSARALQTVVQLMGEREMFEYYADSFKVHHVSWSQEKATAVLDAWQRKFATVSIFKAHLLKYLSIFVRWNIAKFSIVLPFFKHCVCFYRK